MSNPFALRAAAVGAPLGVRHNGESITLTFADAGTKSVPAIVELEEPSSTFDGLVELNGKISIRSTDYTTLVEPNGTAMSTSIGGYLWHIYERESDRFGFVIFKIRRKANEVDHTNMYDMNDQQATWHEP